MLLQDVPFPKKKHDERAVPQLFRIPQENLNILYAFVWHGWISMNLKSAKYVEDWANFGGVSRFSTPGQIKIAFEEELLKHFAVKNIRCGRQTFVQSEVMGLGTA